MRLQLQENIRTALGYSLSAAAIFFESWLFSEWIVVNPTTVGFVFLVTILFVATLFRLGEALFASFLATLLFNFLFLPPVGTLTIEDPLNWVSLVAFLITSLVASELSERARKRTREAENRQTEMERLYAVSRAILLADSKRPTTQQLALDLARTYDLPFVAVYDRSSEQIHHAGPDEIPGIDTVLRDTAIRGTLQRSEKDGTVVMAVSFGGRPVGSLALKSESLSDTALQALSNLVSLAIERAHGREAAIRADAARQSEEFKSTLMDALAHEFKTPLTSIKAAVTAITSASVHKPEEQQEMLEVIRDASDRLSSLVSETVRLARIEASGMQLNKRPYDINAAIDQALLEMKPALESRKVEIVRNDDLPPALVDPELIGIVLRHMIDNAVKYSPTDSPISISARSDGGSAIVAIRNQGEGIAEWEHDRIFEKFYRGARARRRVPGTGMGLAIVRDIISAHGGQIRVESAQGQGTEFMVYVPLVKEHVPA